MRRHGLEAHDGSAEWILVASTSLIRQISCSVGRGRRLRYMCMVAESGHACLTRSLRRIGYPTGRWGQVLRVARALQRSRLETIDRDSLLPLGVRGILRCYMARHDVHADRTTWRAAIPAKPRGVPRARPSHPKPPPGAYRPRSPRGHNHWSSGTRKPGKGAEWCRTESRTCNDAKRRRRRSRKAPSCPSPTPRPASGPRTPGRPADGLLLEGNPETTNSFPVPTE